jgi:hypothetical protein
MGVFMSESERIETLVYVLKGKTLGEIAQCLFLTPKGVKYRLTQVYKFYKVKNRVELMSMFVQYPNEWNNVKSNIRIKKVKPVKKVKIIKEIPTIEQKNKFLLPTGLKF